MINDYDAKIIMQFVQTCYWMISACIFSAIVLLSAFVRNRRTMIFLRALAPCFLLIAFSLPSLIFYCNWGKLPAEIEKMNLIDETFSPSKIKILLGHPHAIDSSNDGYRYHYYADPFYIEWIVVYFDNANCVRFVNRGT
jgi:hypothetical protein